MTLLLSIHGIQTPIRFHAFASSSRLGLIRTYLPSNLLLLHTCTFDARSSVKATYTPILPSVSIGVHRHQGPIAMTSLVQARLHGAHSHSHSHHQDNTYLTSSNKKDAGVRITRLGLYVNLAMALGKGVGGYYFHSQALLADAFHALTDLVSDFMTLGTVSWSLKSPTPRFPSGYGKIESLGSLGVSSLLLVGGILMGLNACEVLYHELLADITASGVHSHGHVHDGLFGHSHSHNTTDLGPNLNAAWLAAGSIVVKEYLYRASTKGSCCRTNKLYGLANKFGSYESR